jgi:pSer/pThr/pTyr-binding forkhead associated (FHA) protein
VVTSDQGGGRDGGGPGLDPHLDFEIDDLASALQLDGHRDPGDSAVSVADADIEEIVDPPEEPTHPQRLYVTVEGRVHPVTKDRFVIGRVSSQCDLAIIDANVSRQHCAIERREGFYVIVDLGSTNGIELDGRKVDNHPIANGEVFVLSGHRVACSFEPPAVEAPAPVRAATQPASATGRLVPVPRALAREPEPEPEPDEEPEPETVEPAGFEQRVEIRLAALAEEVAQLRAGMHHVIARLESLKGVDALAQLIQRRLQAAKRR